MNARKSVHAQKPYSSQAYAHESSKVGGSEKKRETGKKAARRVIERKAAKKKELKRGQLSTAQVNKTEGGIPNFVVSECDLLPSSIC